MNIFLRLLPVLGLGIYQAILHSCSDYYAHEVPGSSMDTGSTFLASLFGSGILLLLFLLWSSTMVDSVNQSYGSQLALAIPRWTDSLWGLLYNPFSIIHLVAWCSMAMSIIPLIILPVRCGFNGFLELVQGAFNGVIATSTLFISMYLCIWIRRRKFPNIEIDYSQSPIANGLRDIPAGVKWGFLIGGAVGMGCGYPFEKDGSMLLGFIIGAPLGIFASIIINIFQSKRLAEDTAFESNKIKSAMIVYLPGESGTPGKMGLDVNMVAGKLLLLNDRVVFRASKGFKPQVYPPAFEINFTNIKNVRYFHSPGIDSAHKGVEFILNEGSHLRIIFGNGYQGKNWVTEMINRSGGQIQIS